LQFYQGHSVDFRILQTPHLRHVNSNDSRIDTGIAKDAAAKMGVTWAIPRQVVDIPLPISTHDSIARSERNPTAFTGHITGGYRPASRVSAE
jgi:hypothetical protein